MLHTICEPNRKRFNREVADWVLSGWKASGPVHTWDGHLVQTFYNPRAVPTMIGEVVRHGDFTIIIDGVWQPHENGEPGHQVKKPQCQWSKPITYQEYLRLFSRRRS